jgi:hypothetical protein
MLSAIMASADNRKYARKPGCRKAAKETGGAGEVGEEVEAFMELLEYGQTKAPRARCSSTTSPVYPDAMARWLT